MPKEEGKKNKGRRRSRNKKSVEDGNPQPLLVTSPSKNDSYGARHISRSAVTSPVVSPPPGPTSGQPELPPITSVDVQPSSPPSPSTPVETALSGSGGQCEGTGKPGPSPVSGSGVTSMVAINAPASNRRNAVASEQPTPSGRMWGRAQTVFPFT
ncbi:hypothetical protein MTO96_011104 [Rhipicephalus appendiculatus]